MTPAVERLLLLDKSAVVRDAADHAPAGELCLCAVTRLEVLYSARSARDYARMDSDLDAFRELCTDAETLAIARSAQRDLAERGQHRLPIPDLLIAACAHQYGGDVLHVDRHYDALATVLGFRSIRLAS